MRTAVTAAVLALTLLAGACGGRRAPEFTRADAEAVRNLTADYVSAFNSKNLDDILTVYTEAAVFMPPNRPLIRGKDALRSYYQDLIAKGATGLRMEPGDVGGQGTLAFQSGSFSINYEPAGVPPTRDRGKYVFVLSKSTGAWKFDYTIWSSDLPPPQTARK
jgi:ketosteroid isomerase-like protein